MNIFITGGTTGIGAALAKYYLGQGHRVGVCGRSDANFKKSFENLAPRVSFYRGDVADREFLNKAVSDFSKNQRLDVMIANAGIGMDKKQDVVNWDFSHQMVRTNLTGVMNSFEAAMALMIPQKHGRLVAISSVAGFVGLPGASMYSATKSFVTTLCESFSIDLKKYGITTTAICPGFIDTPLTHRNKHPMPFLMDVDVAAKRIVTAIEGGKELYVFPLRMNIIITLLKLCPRWIYRALTRLLNSRIKY